MEVPEFMLNFWSFHAARTLTPGPVMSGFRIPGVIWLGPREENEAIAGEWGVFMAVPLKMIVAVGEEVELM